MQFSRILTGLFCLVTLFSAHPAPGLEAPLAGPVVANVLRVIDGDTVEVEALIWLGQRVVTRVRILGIDTPEKHGKCEQERALAQNATDYLVEKLPPGAAATLWQIVVDKYGGRVVAEIHDERGNNLGPLLIQKGLARVYDGGHKQPWCP